MPVIDIKNALDLESLLNRYKMVVVEVYGTFCGPCKYLAPKFEELSNRYSSEHVVFCKNNIETNLFTQQSGDFSVSALPTVLYFTNGQVVHQVRGADIDAIEKGLQSIPQQTFGQPKFIPSAVPAKKKTAGKSSSSSGYKTFGSLGS